MTNNVTAAFANNMYKTTRILAQTDAVCSYPPTLCWVYHVYHVYHIHWLIPCVPRWIYQPDGFCEKPRKTTCGYFMTEAFASFHINLQDYIKHEL